VGSFSLFADDAAGGASGFSVLAEVASTGTPRAAA